MTFYYVVPQHHHGRVCIGITSEDEPLLIFLLKNGIFGTIECDAKGTRFFNSRREALSVFKRRYKVKKFWPGKVPYSIRGYEFYKDI